ncbi:hypothetical protein NGC37_09495 [Pantoea anthophila]|uniref:hypothetical protein n=1 Tax=Pantoea anthophila TaxID=470931 RepID=UPI002DBD73BE|nr:hypothetical protein [Pantoea anthophila]MEB7538543.1 hypothetical protein [Pantoea anthophila]
MAAFHIITEDSYFFKGVACLLGEYCKDCKIYHTTGDSYLFVFAYEGLIILDKRLYVSDRVNPFHKAIMESKKRKIVVSHKRQNELRQKAVPYTNCRFTDSSLIDLQSKIKEECRKRRVSQSLREKNVFISQQDL